MEQEHIALYRRFRPQTFDEITYQDAPVAALKQAVKSGKIGHAYLFAGQRGTGKTTIAKVFSRAINCLDPKDGNPCNECEICKGIMNGSLLDVIEIDAASNNGVENVRRICDEAVFAPTKARYKVYIIDEVHMLSTGAYNALLKTLEEPPKHVVFLFATTEQHKILPTILSRCQRYSFKRIPDDLIVKRLKYICDTENIKAEDDALNQIAALSDGALRDAISLLDQAAGAADGKEITSRSVQDIAGSVDTALLIEMGDVLIDGNYEALIRLCTRISQAGKDYLRFTLDLAEYFRDLLVIRVVPDPSELVCYSASDMKQLYRTANKANPDTLIGFISYLSKMASDLKVSPSVAANFETSLIRICGRKTNLPVTPLVIPDFEKKQAAAAASISSGAKPEVKEEKKEEDKTEAPKEEPKKEEPKKEEPKAEEPRKEEPKKEEPKKEEPKSELLSSFLSVRSPLRPDDDEKSVSSLSMTERLAQLRASISSSKEEDKNEDQPVTVEEEKKEEPVKKSASSAFFISDPSAPVTIFTAPPEVDENAPLANQIDLFSSLSSKPEEKKEEPKEEKKSGIAGLSDSFVDDIDMSFIKDGGKKEEKAEEKSETKEEDKPEEKKEEPKKEPKKEPRRENRTSLSQVYDKSGLIVSNAHTKEVRQPEFTDIEPTNTSRWGGVLHELSQTNPNLHNTLVNAEFLTIEDNGYIVFEDSYKSVVENLKGMNEFRKLAQKIKATFDGVGRLFVCTKTQYNNALIQDERRKKQEAAEAMKAKAQQMGITTEIHFGDD